MGAGETVQTPQVLVWEQGSCKPVHGLLAPAGDEKRVRAYKLLCMAGS